MKKYTPSPWVAVGTWVEHPSDTVPDICDCDPRIMDQQLYRSDEEACANARLIAAAPDLLNALKKAEDLLYASADENTELNSYGRDCFDAMQQARLAIHKATGERI